MDGRKCRVAGTEEKGEAGRGRDWAWTGPCSSLSTYEYIEPRCNQTAWFTRIRTQDVKDTEAF
jgi:hypothetical protein